MAPSLKTEIAKMRNAAGIKQESFASSLGVNSNYYARVERGEITSERLTQRATAMLQNKSLSTDSR